jgi:alpha-1,6-mannosyltransferase
MLTSPHAPKDAPQRNWLIPIIFGLVIGLCCTGLAILHNLLQHIVPFLILYVTAYLAYSVAIWWALKKPGGRRELALIIGLAILFRVTLLFTSPPTLSDDVYRYIWDGRLMNAGVNPYAYPVNSPLLDPYASPLRALVNHNWMASPYLPAAQLLFALVYRLVPESPLAFQVAAVFFDLLTGWLVIDLLRRLGLPRTRALIYLWNPLVVVESAHGAHVVDALMVCLIMAALWLLIARRSRVPSAAMLAAATLTKGLPVILLPVVARRWRPGPTLLYGSLVVAACAVFALGAGWGLTGPLDGDGLFGALRIYGSLWNYNGGLYHWIEVLVSGHPTPGAVPQEIVGWQPILAAKLIVAAALLTVLGIVWCKERQIEDDLAQLRLAMVPLAAYLLLTTTVHPWYVTLVIPLLPFLTSRADEEAKLNRRLWPWLYLAAAVAFSYLTYLDIDHLREYDSARLLEYVPFYLMLIWSLWTTRGAPKRLSQSQRDHVAETAHVQQQPGDKSPLGTRHN